MIHFYTSLYLRASGRYAAACFYVYGNIDMLPDPTRAEGVRVNTQKPKETGNCVALFFGQESRLCCDMDHIFFSLCDSLQ